MDEIEKAIVALNDIYEGWSSRVPQNGSLAHRNLQALGISIDSLREKQKRDKGCEYCTDNEDLAFGHDSTKRVGCIYIDGNLLVADLYSESMAVAVCYCPMCGKSLKEVANEH